MRTRQNHVLITLPAFKTRYCSLFSSYDFIPYHFICILYRHRNEGPFPYELEATNEDITHIDTSEDITHVYITHVYILLFLYRIYVTHADSDLTL